MKSQVIETPKFILFWKTGHHPHSLELTRGMATRMNIKRARLNAKK